MNTSDIAAILQNFHSGKLSSSQATDAILALDEKNVGPPVAWRRRRKGIYGNGGWIMCPEYPGRDPEFDLQSLFLRATHSPSPSQAPKTPTLEQIAAELCASRGFGFYTEPAEGGQDAYDISCEALREADNILALWERLNPSAKADDFGMKS